MRTTMLGAVLAAGLLSPAMIAATLGQIDTFQDNTTDHWFSGGIAFGKVPPFPPTVTPGGKGGPSDLFMLLTAIGGDNGQAPGIPGSRLSVLNATQWTGNFLTSGIGGIGMDLINLGQTTLDVRLQFEDPMGAPPMDVAVSTNPFVLAAGSGWQHAVFSLNPAAFTAPAGSVTAALNQTKVLRIIHSTVADEATPVVGKLGIDNIQAVALPEPSTLMLIGGGLALLAWKRRLWR
jgi:PEP-CTERM motif